MRVIVYAHSEQLEACVEAVRASAGEDGQVLPRNAHAHVEGQLEACDRVVVDDRYPHIADEYEAAGFDVELVDAMEAGAPEVPSWDLATSPEDYLARYGEDAPNSERALAILKASG